MSILAATAWAQVAINETNFPDGNFRNFVSENYDTDEDGFLAAGEIGHITSLGAVDKSISDLTGIEFFANLEELHCYENQLTSLDVSGLTNLQFLFVFNNQLTSLDVSGLTNLQSLGCGGNQLTELNLTGLTNLQSLDCGGNRLTSLDVSGLSNLTFFIGGGQEIELTLTAAGERYELVINLNALLFEDEGIVWENGVLSAANDEIESVEFSVQTGKADMELSGTLFLTYVGEITTSIRATQKIKTGLFAQNIVSEKLEILPEFAVTEVIIYDVLGNVVHNSAFRIPHPEFVWDLRNSAGRFVANGAYLVVVEAVDKNGKTVRYSGRVGVKR